MYRRKSHHKAGWGRYIIFPSILILVFVGYKVQQYQYFISTPVNPSADQEEIFTIKKGDNIKAIADNLVKKHLLLDADSFSLYSRLNNLDKQIKTGRFPLNESLNTSQIFSVITSNKTRQEIVTIPEGSTVTDIDQILANLNMAPAGEFTKAADNFTLYDKYAFLDQTKLKTLPHPLEGYLFPDTYYVSADNFSSENFITQLLNTFANKALPEAQKSTHSVEDVLNVAAMVEKEANKDEDRPIIAGIIWKRLEQNWPLGIDATLLYQKTDRELTYDDLKEKSPYNTRLQPGLPLGPISNPGLASIKAASNPKETEYLYYLTSKDGQMIYATTNAEHNANKAKYL